MHDYEIVFRRTTEHSFVVTAETVDEAINIAATKHLVDGDDGMIKSRHSGEPRWYFHKRGDTDV